MKKFTLTTLFAFVLFGVFAQSLPVNPETSKIEYQDIIETPGSQAALFSKAKKAIAVLFQSANSVIQAEGRQQEYLVVKGLAFINLTTTFRNHSSSQDVPMHFTLNLDFKDNKYRYTINDIYFKPIQGSIDITIPFEDALMDSTNIREKTLEEFAKSKVKVNKKLIDETVELATDLNEQYKVKGSSTIKHLVDQLKEKMESTSGDDW